ncbi:hypothetical protein B4168_3233 [Anoxybacillus flavithermus]|nr:hypothetical protein B4168_3233 [Anoxybacillus flavithermus]OAO88438.1 hypothetical protein GT23_0406 [Parageobacillus thermoglucosidasius]
MFIEGRYTRNLGGKGSLSVSLLSSAAKIKAQNLLFIYPNEFMKLSKL